MNYFGYDQRHIISSFKNKNWESIHTDKGLLFYKNGAEIYDGDLVHIPKVKCIDLDFSSIYDKYCKITYEFFKDKFGSLVRLNPINIYKGYQNNAFVSTGLEYYYDYLYKNKEVDDKGTIIIQPSIRFKLDLFEEGKYFKGDKYDYSSIAFNNVSLVHKVDAIDYIEDIDLMISYLSKLGIHAQRVNFVIEDKIATKENDVSYNAVKFFVDNLEVGDILFFKTKTNYLIEYGFGFERLISRVVNRKYCELFGDNKYSQLGLLGSNFLTLLCLEDDTAKNRGAKSKINEVINKMESNPDKFNIELIHSNYLYWRKFLINLDCNYEEMTEKYIKMLRRR